jgi:opacity protein-like surface antigen
MSFFERYGARTGARTGKWIAGMSLAAALFTASPAHAQSALPEPNTFDVTPFLGFGMGFSSSDDPLDPLDPSGSSFLIGVAVGYNWTTNLSIEGELGIIPDIVGDTDAVDFGITTFSANGVYHFDTQSPVVPYATLGLGFGHMGLDIEGVGDDSSTEFLVNFGGGVKYPIKDNLAVRGDLRYFAVNDENPNFWRLYGGVTFGFGPR